jgi:hypothetical protein
MVHMMVKDSDAFFNRLARGSQSYPSRNTPSVNLLSDEAPDFIPLEQNQREFSSDAMKGFENPYQNNSFAAFYIDNQIPQLPHSSTKIMNGPGTSRNQDYCVWTMAYANPNYAGSQNNSISSGEDEDEDADAKTSFIRDGRRVFPCKVCGKEFIRGRFRRMHYIKHHPELNRFKCPVCDDSNNLFKKIC